MNGINPVELVTIPYSEFQRDFPNDPDATQRRYERIEGGRKRILAQVTKDWKKLVETGWKPPETKAPPKAETILPVSPNAHCQLLEIQAAKFRKIEQDNWETLNRNLRIQILKADQEVHGQQIIEKQNNIQELNEQQKRERKAALDELERENLRRRQEEEEELQREIKREQIEFADEEKRKHEQRLRQREAEKQFLLKKEEDRVNSQAYTRQTRNAIMNRMESRFNERKKASEIKQQQTGERLNQFFEMRDKELSGRRNAVDQKLQAVKEERMKREEELRQEVLASIREAERKRQHVEQERERLTQQRKKSNDTETVEKMNKIREMTDMQVKMKADRTLHELQYREDLAKQEMEKVREAQERRRRIKTIRREAYEIAKFRADRAEEYRKQRLEQEIRDKEERSAAIRRGFHILEHMRNSMKDIMVKTNLELKDEFHRLRHTGTFSPDRVVKKALEVSNHVLFPSLQHTFGIQDLAKEEAMRQEQNKRFFQTSADGDDGDASGGFSFNLTGNANKDGGGDPLMQTSQSMPLFEGDRTMPRAATATGAMAGRPKSGALQREEVSTLPIHLLTRDRLKSTLMDSMRRVEALREQDESMRRSRSRSQSMRPSPMGTGRYGDDDSDGDADGGPRGPTAILHLHQVEHETNRPDDDMAFGAGASRGRGADHLSLTSSQARQRQGTDLSSSVQRQHGTALLSSSMTIATAPSQQTPSADAARGRGRSPNKRAAQTPKRHVSPTSRSPSSPTHDDTQLPTIEFTAGKEFHDLQEQKELEEREAAAAQRQSRRPKSAATMTSAERKKEALRTDVNKKAKYMAAPKGTFRKEFSLDHPLAPNGKGRYSKELRKGLQPLNMDVPKDPKASNVQETLQLAEKVEKLTYDAQQKVVDSDDGVKRMQEDMAKKLARVIEEERIAEENRTDALRNIPDGEERSKLEQIFAEERARASERIITATKEHDQAVRRALLRTMNLGN
jgi:hypothetical protein